MVINVSSYHFKMFELFVLHFIVIIGMGRPTLIGCINKAISYVLLNYCMIKLNGLHVGHHESSQSSVACCGS